MYHLVAYLDRYLLCRDVSKSYAKLLRARLVKFAEWAGNPAIDAIDCELVNRFLSWLQETGAKAYTVDGYRRSILCVWNEALMEGANDHAPTRLRKVRRPHVPVTAFTHAEIQKLLAVAESLAGWFPNGAKRADFWTAAIHSAYSTGLRRGDLLRLERSLIGDDGLTCVSQRKTGYPVFVRLSRPALDAVHRMAHVGPLAIPWPYHENALARQFRSIVKTAGVRAGQFRWLRRSAGSYAEKQARGNGSRLLGHRCESVFRGHYDDLTISLGDAISPPPIMAG